MNIVFDIGGTNLRVATAEGTEVGAIKKIATPKSFTDALNVLGSTARELAAGSSFGAAGGCISGTVSPSGVISDARNLSEWEGENAIVAITQTLGVPAVVVNDAGAVGLAEASQGAGKGFRAVGYLTVSTGVGGARIVAGKIESAGGIGWTPVGDSDLESSISGTAVQRKFGIPPKELESIEERNKLADLLAEGLAKIYEKWRPDVFVIGGSMIVGMNPIPLGRVSERFTAIPVMKAELADNGGLIGGAILASQ